MPDSLCLSEAPKYSHHGAHSTPFRIDTLIVADSRATYSQVEFAVLMRELRANDLSLSQQLFEHLV